MKNNDYHNQLLKTFPESYQDWFKKEQEYLERNISKNSSVLEVGCGDGRSIFDLLPMTENITGIDHDEKAIQEISRRFIDYPSIKFIKADVEHLPFENDSFDYVICMTSFANFSEKKFQILEEMKRVLKDGGQIIISVFSQNAFPERMKVYKNLNVPIKEIKDGTVIFDESVGDNISEQFSKDQLMEIFHKVGLVVKDITEVNIAYLCTLSKESRNSEYGEKTKVMIDNGDIISSQLNPTNML